MKRASRDVLPSRSRVIYSEGRTLRFEDFDLRPEILKALADLGTVPQERVAQAIKIYGIKPERIAPWRA